MTKYILRWGNRKNTKTRIKLINRTDIISHIPNQTSQNISPKKNLCNLVHTSTSTVTFVRAASYIIIFSINNIILTQRAFSWGPEPNQVPCLIFSCMNEISAEQICWSFFLSQAFDWLNRFHIPPFVERSPGQPYPSCGPLFHRFTTKTVKRWRQRYVIEAMHD